MLIWHERKANDVETNQLDCYWAVGSAKAYPRLYRIVEQYPADANGLRIGGEPELYVLFEEINGRSIRDVFTNEKELNEWKSAKQWGDFWFNGDGRFVHAYKTLKEAKARAEVQLKHISDLIDATSILQNFGIIFL